ncbi:radical SAM protein [[Eubacterium] cellulosolvens]
MSFPELEMLRYHSFEMGPIRPTAEGGSHALLVRVTRNCPWSQCGFCHGIPYNRKRFQLRVVDDVKRDINAAREICSQIQALSKKLGGMEWAAQLVDPYFLYNKSADELTVDEANNFQSIVNVFNWIYSEGKTAFLQDADTPIMPGEDLRKVIRYLKTSFPQIERITSYARSKTLFHKSMQELKDLRCAGLTRLYVGLESGDDEILKLVRKGVTSEEQIQAGKKVKESGYELSEFCITGLGGRERTEQNAKNTAKALNLINPDYIRIRRYVPRKDSPLLEDWKTGRFKLLTPHEELTELQAMIKKLDVTSKVCFDHYINYSYKIRSNIYWILRQDHEGYQFPNEKDVVLKSIENGLSINESLFVHAEELTEGFI